MKSRNRWRFALRSLHLMEFRGELIYVSVHTDEQNRVVTVNVLDVENFTRYWVGVGHTPERQELEPDDSGMWEYDLRPDITFQMASSDREEVFRLMRKAMSYNRAELGDRAKKAWEEAWELVRQTELSEDRVILHEEGPYDEEDDFDWVAWAFGPHDPNW